MHVYPGDVIEHNGRRARVMCVVGTRVTVEWCNGRIQSGPMRALWMVTLVACGVHL
jgi:hypothetical protein